MPSSRGSGVSMNPGAMPESPDSAFLDDDIGDVESIQHHRQLPTAVIPSSTSYLSNGQRLTLGIVVLILVDVIWVASSELSEYIFHDEKFNKPFFSTYLKTSMFLIFLLGFLFWTPWQESCCSRANSHSYSRLACDPYEVAGDHGDTTDNNANEAPLSSPTFVPINYDPSSGNESSDDTHIQQRGVRFNKVAEVRHMSESEAADAVFARLSYQATLQAHQIANRMANKLGITQTAQLSLTFCLLWFVANYSYQLAISNTEAGIVNVLSSSSSLFTLLLAAIFPAVVADKFTLSKFLGVLLSFAGVVAVSLSDFTIEKAAVPLGAIFAVVSAFFYACYLVFLRRKVDHEDKLEIPMFFGFVGLFNLIMLWPIFFILHYSSIENFELPTHRQWIFLILNGIIGTVFSEVLWLWGCFLTSSLIATLAISLTIPLSMVADVLLKRISYSPLFYIGAVPMVLSFFIVTILTHYEGWDPVLDLLKSMKKAFKCKKGEGRYRRILINDIEQRESLIGINYDHIGDMERNHVHDTTTASDSEDSDSHNNTVNGDSVMASPDPHAQV